MVEILEPEGEETPLLMRQLILFFDAKRVKNSAKFVGCWLSEDVVLREKGLDIGHFGLFGRTEEVKGRKNTLLLLLRVLPCRAAEVAHLHSY